MLAGCSAGFLNVAKIKGSHTAMKTGMLAAEAIFDRVKDVEELDVLDCQEVTEYESNVMSSWVAEELKESRNFKSGFSKFGGLWGGLAHGGLV